MATHRSILAWRIPGTGVPDGLQSMGSQRVRHDSDFHSLTCNWVGHCCGSLKPHPSSTSEQPCEIRRRIVCSRDSRGDHRKNPVLLDSPTWPQIPYTSGSVHVFTHSGSQGVLGLGTEKQDKGEKQGTVDGDAVRPCLCKAGAPGMTSAKDLENLAY